jgi:hypothetical protein
MRVDESAQKWMGVDDANYLISIKKSYQTSDDFNEE